MEEFYICPNCGGFGSSRDIICPQCGHSAARSGASSKLRLFVITAVILAGLGFGMFLFGVPSELRSAIRSVTDTLNSVTGNDLDQLKESGFKECEECDLSGVDLAGGDLRGANLSEANLGGANLTSANLSDANLGGANLTSANLSGANLSGADLTDANLDRADLTRANLLDTNLSEAQLKEANLDGVIGADLTGDLKVPDLTETSKPASETEAEERICFDIKRQAAWDNYTTFTRIEGTNGDDQISFGPGVGRRILKDDGLRIQQCFNMGNLAKYKMTSSPGGWQIHDNGRSLKLDGGIGDGNFNDNVIMIPSGKGKFTQEGQTFYYTYDLNVPDKYPKESPTPLLTATTYATSTPDSASTPGSESGAVLVTAWGTYGTGDGEFNAPRGVAVASDGSVFVADWRGHRIQKFTSEGVFVSKWGTLGTGDGEFIFPKSVAVAFDGSVYVADTHNSRIQKFTSEGVFVSKWGTPGTGDGEFERPQGVAVASDGSVYVADSSNRSIADDHNSSIKKFTSEGVFVSKWGTEGSGYGELQDPHGVAVASDGSVYIADRMNNRIQKFTSEGVFVTKWGRYGYGDGEFAYPLGIAVASDGSVYVADSDNGRIQKFTSEGVFVSKWGKAPVRKAYRRLEGEFDSPWGIAVASDGSVYVADWGGIQKFSPGS